MLHHLMPHVLGARFSKQIILLDTIRDRYGVLTHVQSATVAPYLGITLLDASINSTQRAKILKQLIDANWITTEATFSEIDPKFNTDSPTPQTGGMSANGWKLPDDAFEHRPPYAHIVKAFFILRSVHKCAVRDKLPGLLKQCMQAAQKPNLTFGQPEDYASFVKALNWACLFYPKPTKCLEWSVALTLLCAQAGLALKLIIGVQSFPFYAHAWSEAQGIVIGDSPRRREELAVILEFPTPLLDLPYGNNWPRLSKFTSVFNSKSKLAAHT